MHEIDGADMCVSVVRCVCHAVCPLTEDFELFVCHSVIHHVLELFRVICIVPIADYLDRYVVQLCGHWVLPEFHFTCIYFVNVYEAVNNFFVHVLEF